MKIYISYVLLLCLFLSLFCCKNNEKVISNSFITKRKYNRGWHINNNAKITEKRDIPNKQKEESVPKYNEINYEDETETYTSVNSDILTNKNSSSLKTLEQYVIAAKDSSKKIKRKIRKQKEIDYSLTTDSIEKITNPKALQSFFAMIGHMATGGLLLVALHNSSLIFILLFSYVFFYTSPAVVFLSLLALKDRKKEPNKYKKTGLAIPGLIYGLLVFSFYLTIQVIVFFSLSLPLSIAIALGILALISLAYHLYLKNLKKTKKEKKPKIYEPHSDGSKKNNIYAFISFALLLTAMLFFTIQFLLPDYIEPFAFEDWSTILILVLLLLISVIFSIVAYKKNSENPDILKNNWLLYPSLIVLGISIVLAYLGKYIGLSLF